MADKNIISAGIYNDSNVYILSTDGQDNFIEIFDGWNRYITTSWAGTEISGGCCFNEIVVCSTVGSKIYVIENKHVREIDLGGIFINGIEFKDERKLLAVGNKGRIYHINIDDFTIQEDRLSNYGVSKPGRDFININKTVDGLLLCGKKQLIIEIVDSLVNDLGASSYGDGFYFNAIKLKNDVWVSGLLGPRPILTSYRNGHFHLFDTPTEKQRAPTIGIYDGLLTLANEKVFIGAPDSWKEIHDFGEPSIISTVILSKTPKRLVCVGFTGKIDVISMDT